MFVVECYRVGVVFVVDGMSVGNDLFFWLCSEDGCRWESVVKVCFLKY